MRRLLRHLHDDGLESLGTVTLGTTLVVGDPIALPHAPGTGAWHGVAVQPGEWWLFGRPWEPDPDQLEEIVAVHGPALESFYELYDEAEASFAALLPTGRVALLDGALRTDADLLRELSGTDIDALPWLLERGCLAAGVELNPVTVFQPQGSVVTLVSATLGPSAGTHAVTTPFEMDETVS